MKSKIILSILAGIGFLVIVAGIGVGITLCQWLANLFILLIGAVIIVGVLLAALAVGLAAYDRMTVGDMQEEDEPMGYHKASLGHERP